MKVLKDVRPTGEQLTVIQDSREGPFVIRGAAGSGKTTTALYRLKTTVRFWQRRHKDGYLEGPIRVLVLTYNRTLRGYVAALAQDQVVGKDVELEIRTFAKWAYNHVGKPPIVNGKSKILDLGLKLLLPHDFLLDEVQYVLGRFPPTALESYIGCDRRGRGRSPQMPDDPLRRRLLDEVIYPYAAWKKSQNYSDWNDVATAMVGATAGPYHVVVVDESQDFSANQIRAVLAQLASDHTITFVLDGAQRIYPQRFFWSEVGLTIGPRNSRQLSANFRNTVEVARFAAALLKTVEVTDDSSLPNFDSCTAHGPKPWVVQGRFSKQMDWLIAHLQTLDEEDDVAILHAKGGDWFDEVRARLRGAGLTWVELSGNADWPVGPPYIGLSTMNSVKGLEFDHVVVVGLNQETMPHGAEEGDSLRDAHLRLLAMAAGRARKTLAISYKLSEASDLVACFDPDTYGVVTL